MYNHNYIDMIMLFCFSLLVQNAFRIPRWADTFFHTIQNQTVNHPLVMTPYRSGIKLFKSGGGGCHQGGGFIAAMPSNNYGYKLTQAQAQDLLRPNIMTGPL